VVYPLRVGAASLVIYKDGSAIVGEWGCDARLTPNVVAIRQNLNPAHRSRSGRAGLEPR
jgi:hypothetical protein